MLIDDFCRFLEKQLNGKTAKGVFAIPLQDQNTAGYDGTEQGKRRKRVTEGLIVDRVFNRAKTNTKSLEEGLYTPSEFYEKGGDAQFFGFYPGRPDRIYFNNSPEGLCIEFKIYRKNPDKATATMDDSVPGDESGTDSQNNGYDIRNGFLQLLEYMLKDGKEGKTKPSEGAVVVFDKLNKHRPKFLSDGKTKIFLTYMQGLFEAYNFHLHLIWIWEEENQSSPGFTYELCKGDDLSLQSSPHETCI